MNSWNIPGRYDFSIPEAQLLSDLSGIDSDLEAVLRICARCEKHMKEMSPPVAGPGMEWLDDVQALGDLTFAAVVRYGRTLATGKREKIQADWINALPDPMRESHTYFKALRDKYIAHSVNQLEDNQVFVQLTPQFSEQQEPTHITVDRGRLVTLGLSDLRRLVILVKALRKVVANEIESETSRVLAIARATPIEEIRARRSESIAIPGKAETYKVRKNFER